MPIGNCRPSSEEQEGHDAPTVCTIKDLITCELGGGNLSLIATQLWLLQLILLS